MARSQPEQIVEVANNRCHQENLLAQLHGGVSALKSPVNTLASNGAYMVMTALAWNLKAWCRPHLQHCRWPENRPLSSRLFAMGL